MKQCGKTCNSQSARIGIKQQRCCLDYDNLSFTDVQIYQSLDCFSLNCLAQMESDESPIKSKESNHNYILNLTQAHLMPQVFWVIKQKLMARTRREPRLILLKLLRFRFRFICSRVIGKTTHIKMIIDYLSGVFRLSYWDFSTSSGWDITLTAVIYYVFVRSMTHIYPLHTSSEIRNVLG